MTEFVYRFRPVRALLEVYNELEKQQIYFSTLQELNDPLEGFKDVFWQGDVILWANLFRHYLLCLMQAMTIALIGGPDYKFSDEDSFVFMTKDSLPTDTLRRRYQSTCERFFSWDDTARLPEILASRTTPVRRNELILYLRTLHFRALDILLDSFVEAKLLPARPAGDALRSNAQRVFDIEALVRGFNSLPSRGLTEEPAAVVGVIAMAAALQINLIASYNDAGPRRSPAWRTILLDFPMRHVVNLERLMFRDGYTACFVKDPMQSSMWGVYADSHRGACLKFRCHGGSPGKPCVRLKTATGLSGGRGVSTRTVYGDVLHELHEVTYAPRFIQIDFFRSLGTVTMPMLNNWYRDSTGKASDRVLDILGDSAEWRAEYWEAYRKSMTTKLDDWSHESEYRCALHSIVVDLTDKSARKLEYDFSDLEGIIFGLQTSNEDKIDIVRIIERKCRETGRKRFEFRQAYYAPWSGKIDSIPLSLIKFS